MSLPLVSPNVFGFSLSQLTLFFVVVPEIYVEIATLRLSRMPFWQLRSLFFMPTMALRKHYFRSL